MLDGDHRKPQQGKTAVSGLRRTKSWACPAARLDGNGIGSAADFDASGTDGGGGQGPHGRDAGRIALPSDSWANTA